MKNQLRKIAIQKRKELDITALSKKALINLFSTNEYKNSTNILCYYPLKYEIQTQKCLEDAGKTWYLPRVNGGNLEICTYEKNSLHCGKFNIQEPSNNAIDNVNVIDMVIIPAVAADRNGYRIGYGKGFYDRFLPTLRKDCKKIILVFSDCLFENIYPNEYDIKSDIIISDKEILRF